MILSKHFVNPETKFLIKILKHNRFNIRANNIKHKNVYLLYDMDNSFIVKDRIIFASYKSNRITLEQILDRTYDDMD
jgi:hypothetical protein